MVYASFVQFLLISGNFKIFRSITLMQLILSFFFQVLFSILISSEDSIRKQNIGSLLIIWASFRFLHILRCQYFPHYLTLASTLYSNCRYIFAY